MKVGSLYRLVDGRMLHKLRSGRIPSGESIGWIAMGSIILYAGKVDKKALLVVHREKIGWIVSSPNIFLELEDLNGEG